MGFLAAAVKFRAVWVVVQFEFFLLQLCAILNLHGTCAAQGGKFDAHIEYPVKTPCGGNHISPGKMLIGA